MPNSDSSTTAIVAMMTDVMYVLSATPPSAGSERLRSSRLLLPEPESTGEGIGIAAPTRTSRQSFQRFCVAATEHDLIGQQRVAKPLHDGLDEGAPFLVPQPLATLPAQKMFVAVTVAKCR